MATQIGREAFEAALPDVTSTMTLPGLDQPVEIIRDHYGVPHIRAATLHDAFFAQGFVHGQDRLWQLEFDRRRAEGRWAECAGSAAIAQDTFMRRARIVDSGKADYEAFDAETKGMCDAYNAGVDAFMRERGRIPFLFRTAAHREPIVNSLFAHMRAVMGPGEVPELLKELLSVRVSHINGCEY